MFKTLQRTVAFVLMFSNVVAGAGTQGSASMGRTPMMHAGNTTTNSSSFRPNAVPQMETPANLALSSEQFGLTGPLNLGVNYSDLTGTYVTAQYVKRLSDIWAFGLLGEYGNDQYRYNGTLGLQVSPTSLIKVSAERLNQRLPFMFDSGSIYRRISQDAVGGRYQKVFNENFLVKALDFGGYYAAAHNMELSPVIYMSNGMNCLGNPTGLACINERNIAGGISSGADVGFTLLLSPKTLLQARLNYDQVHYSTIFSSNSHYNRQGFGTTVNLEQLLTSRLKFTGGFEYRAIYNSFNVALSWLSPFFSSAQTEISLFAQRIVSKNPTPDNNIVGLKIAFLGDIDRTREKDYQINPTAFLSDLTNWVREPAVKMNQVLAIAEQIVRLLAPSVQSLNPNSGPLSGGNVITINGTNFNGDPPTVLIDGQFAVVKYISPAQLSVTIPAALPRVVSLAQSTHQSVPVNVILKNEDGQQTTVTNGYIYTTAVFGAPVITAVTPSSGNTGGHTIISIVGQNFTNGATVTIGGINAEIISVSSTLIEAVTPAHAAGVVAIVVTTAAGSTTFSSGFTYTSTAPDITSITPNIGSVAGNTTTTITGTNLNAITSVSFGGVPASSFVVNSSTSITAVTPAYSGGALAVNVLVSDGTSNATLVNGFTYQLGTPSISTISPNQGSTSGGTTITVTGSGFATGTTITIGGIPATNITVINPTTLMATIPAYVSGPLVKDVQVNNGEGIFTLAGGFTYIASTPELSSLTPTNGSTAGGTTITLSGSGFVAGTTVTLGGTSATDVHIIDATTLTAVTPAHASGIVDVVVNNGVGSATLSAAYTYLANAPTLTAINPTTGSVAGGVSVTLTGTGLTGMTGVSFAGVLATSVVVVNDTTMTAVVPAYVSGPLVIDVIVSNNSSNATLVSGFTYQAGPPTLGSISPNTSSVAGGVTATIHGTNFVPGTTVTIGGVASTNINVINATTATLTIPAYVSGPLIKNVVVNNGVGSATLVGGFTYTANAPTLSSISPITGSITGGTLVTLTGTDFTPGTTVTFGGVAATNVNVSSANTLTAVTPAYVSGALTVDVMVNNGVSNATLSHAFTYQAIAPALTSITPNSDSVAGGATITVSGSGFVPTTTLTIGGIAAANIHVSNVTTLTATVPAYVSGSLIKDVVVNNGAGIAMLTSGFTYIESAPGLSGLTPGTGSILGGTTVTLTGSGFAPGTTVTFGGVSATAVTVVNS
ncbi:MAG: IPT/TIG domain-containing protein, partial [Legionella sp.]|uniref:IPT/TIG domain-containing protein n=1 Tax=Legionella sp. TaxID=459 RepID=UPI0028400B19|nr:IPT/TIG domain-containing protein [Legionella sp.]